MNDSLDAPSERLFKDDRNINLVLVLCTVLILWNIYSLYQNYYSFYIQFVIYLLVSTVLLIGIAIGLYGRKKFGWIILIFILTLGLISGLFEAITFYTFYAERFESDISENAFYRNSAINNVIILIISIVIQGVLLWYFWKPRLREKFDIEKGTAKTTIIIGIALALCLFVFGYFI